MIERLLEAERALSVGLLDQAERLYQQAWEADPNNSIAVAGLARVALERGDEPTAHALGLRALEIDADNLAARRLVDRLVEVQAARSKPDVAPAASAPPPEPSKPAAPEAAKTAATRSRGPHVGPPASIRTSTSGKRRTGPPPTATGPTLPKARPLASPPKPTPTERPPAAAAQPRPPKPAAKRATTAKPKEDEDGKQLGLFDRLFGPRR